MILVKF